MNYTHIIIDEIHERNISINLILILLKIYLNRNIKVKLKIILMKVNIDENIFIKYFECFNCSKIPIIQIKENIHKITEYDLEDI